MLYAGLTDCVKFVTRAARLQKASTTVPIRGRLKPLCASPALKADTPERKQTPNRSKRTGQAKRGRGPPLSSRKAPKGAKRSAESPARPLERQRLAKALADAGSASRRASEDLITQGQVTVNGKVVTVPQTGVNPLEDVIKVKNQLLPRTLPKRYIFALNKPKGYLCASSTPEGTTSRLVVDLFKDWIEKEWKPDHLSKHAIPPRLFTVGRLDSQSTGLIFVTNDGPWAQSVQHPSSGLTKEYVVTTATTPTARQLSTIAAGCEVDGAFVRPVSLSLMTDQRSKFRVVVSEGRNREVRNLVANAGLDVQTLKRVRIGGYRLERELGIGQYKLLKAFELRRVTDKAKQT